MGNLVANSDNPVVIIQASLLRPASCSIHLRPSRFFLWILHEESFNTLKLSQKTSWLNGDLVWEKLISWGRKSLIAFLNIKRRLLEVNNNLFGVMGQPQITNDRSLSFPLKRILKSWVFCNSSIHDRVWVERGPNLVILHVSLKCGSSIRKVIPGLTGTKRETPREHLRIVGMREMDTSGIIMGLRDRRKLQHSSSSGSIQVSNAQLV